MFLPRESLLFDLSVLSLEALCLLTVSVKRVRTYPRKEHTHINHHKLHIGFENNSSYYWRRFINLRPDSNKTGRIYYTHWRWKVSFFPLRNLLLDLCAFVPEKEKKKRCAGIIPQPHLSKYSSVSKFSPFEIQLLGIKLHLFKHNQHGVFLLGTTWARCEKWYKTKNSWHQIKEEQYCPQLQSPMQRELIWSYLVLFP